MSLTLPRRFYQSADAAPAEGGFAVRLDGKGVRTPAGRPLLLPTLPLAEAVAAEWAAQDELIRPHTMPLTQLSSTALDRVGPERPAITDQLVAYAGTDLLCYRVDSPADLAARQTATWQPLLDWLALALDAPLTVTHGLLAVAQPDASIAALRRHLDGQSVWRLAVIQAATAASGSLVLALALAEGRVDAAGVVAASQLDETYQAELWGDDAEAVARRQTLAADVEAAAALLALLPPGL